jgi:putative transposase
LFFKSFTAVFKGLYLFLKTCKKNKSKSTLCKKLRQTYFCKQLIEKQHIMRHTFFKLWTHGIFQTPAETMISPELEAMLHYQIEKHLVDQGCEVSIVGGMPDHVHFLFVQNPLISLHDTFHFVKLMTTRWYQLHDFKASFHKFQWAEGYCAYSVSESLLPKTKIFIETQAAIHLKMGTLEEIERLNTLHNVDMRDWGFEND